MRVSARKTALVGAAALALALSACGGDDDGGDDGAASGDGGGSVTVRGCNPENPLVPVNTNETCGGDVLDQLFSKLVRYDPETAEPSNEIAESIESEDNVTWTITLNDGWTFHDGTPITAQSFVDAWNYGAYGPNGNLNSYFFEPIVGYTEVAGQVDDAGAYIEGSATAETMSGLQVVDDLTFTATLVSPQSSFPLRLGYTAYAPMPEAFFADPEAFGEAPIGSGRSSSSRGSRTSRSGCRPTRTTRASGSRRSTRSRSGSTRTSTPPTTTCRPTSSTSCRSCRPPHWRATPTRTTSATGGTTAPSASTSR